VAGLVGEGSLLVVDNDESLVCHNSSGSIVSFGGGDGGGNSDDDVTIAVTSSGGEPDSNWVGACLLGGTAEGPVQVSFEPFGESDEFEVGVIESEYSELGGVELSDEGGGGEGRAEEVFAAASLHGEGHQEEAE